MQHDMILGARQTSDDEAYSFLDTAEYGVLALVDADKEPYAVPLSFARRGNTIYFHGSKKPGHKWSCIESSPKASFCAVASTGLVPDKFTTAYESVICFGTIRDIEDGPEKTDGLVALLEKYSAEHMQEGMNVIDRAAKATRVFALDIERLSGKRND